MQPAKVEIIPARPAVCTDKMVVLDVLVRITAPVPEVHFLRPPINLGIVIDRSGSMASGRKIEHAREAASFAISQLLPTDRVSLTIYDDVVQTIAPSAVALDKPALIARIRGIRPGGSTALHAGWAAGAEQVAQYVEWEGLNRVLLLSDGLANVGLTEPEAIRGEVRAMAGRGVSTTAIGLGDDYNEDLLEAMAQAGDGNYYYVETPVQLADIFQTELHGLMATTGREVGLRMEAAGEGVVPELLTELEREPSGRCKLPNLVIGMPLSIVVRLKVPPQRRQTELCKFHLDWDEPGAESPGRRSRVAALTLPAVPIREWSGMPVDPAVAEHVALMMAAAARKEALQAIDKGDVTTARSWLTKIREIFSHVPATTETASDLDSVNRTYEHLVLGHLDSAKKSAHYQQYQRKRGRDTAR